MTVTPQYLFDSEGNAIGVFLPIDEWNKLAEHMRYDLPQWQEELDDARLEEHSKSPDNTLDWDDIAKEL